MSKPVAYVINIARRHERWAKMQQLWSQWFELIHWPATEIASDGARGCKLSHEAVAEYALRHSEMVIVLEDDAVPTPAFEQIGLACLEDARKHVEHWEWINCGPYLNCNPIRLPCARLSPTISPLFFRATYSQQTHFVCYNAKSLRLLQQSLASAMALDVYLGSNVRTQWVPIKLLAKQDDSPSDIIYHPVDVLKPKLYELSEQMLARSLVERVETA